MTRAYPSPAAALSLVALGLSAADAVSVVRALPSFASNLGRSVYLSRVMWNRGHDTSLGWAREWCDAHGLLQDEPRASGAVGGVRYVL